jgi:aminopeptidase N
VIAALGTIALDPDVIAKARAAVDRALAGNAELEPTMAGAVIKTAAMHGDAALFEALSAAAERASDPNERYRYLYALADFRDPVLVERGLKLALSAQLRSQDTAIYLARFFANPDARDRALTFLGENWTALEPKVAIFGGDTVLIGSMARFCDARSRDRITAFFAEHKLPAAARTLDQTIEQINNCIVLREKQTPAVEAWLAAR